MEKGTHIYLGIVGTAVVFFVFAMIEMRIISISPFGIKGTITRLSPNTSQALSQDISTSSFGPSNFPCSTQKIFGR